MKTVLLLGALSLTGRPDMVPFTGSAEKPQEIPAVKKRVDPSASKSALKQQQEGEAFVRVNVDSRGQITSAQVIKATTEELGAAALEAARQWEFSPATDKKGKAVKSEATIPFKFKLGQEGKSDADKEITPVPIHRVNPDYPESAKREKREGNVVVRVEIDVEGNIASAKILVGDGEDLNAAALNAANGWRFEPVKKDGKAIAASAVIPFQFKLETKAPR